MTDTVVVEKSMTLNGMQIQMRVGYGRGELVFSSVVDRDSEAEITDVVDRLDRVVERQKLKSERADKVAHLRRNRELLASGKLDKDIDNIRRQRADYDMARGARFVSGARRGEFKPTERDKTEYKKFEQQIETAEKVKADLKAGIPITEWQIDCLDARIAGQPEPPMPEAVEAALRTIELPEDVSIAA